MTPEELADIKAITEAATPGPWSYTEWVNAVYTDNSDYFNGKDSICQCWYKDETDMPNMENNVIFIARARQTVPALIAEVERLQAENEQLRRYSRISESGGINE